MPRSIEDIIRNAINTGDFTPSAGAGIRTRAEDRRVGKERRSPTTPYN